jgi:peptidoglycan DL-endopeptidase LytF
MPTLLLIVIVAGVAGSILALRMLGESPGAPVVETPRTDAVAVVPEPEAALPELPPTRIDSTASRGGGIRFTVRNLEPTYTVITGDNLSSIAQRFNTTVEAIQAINNLPDSRTLSVGQRLVIP